jgi:hypothetical protein
MKLKANLINTGLQPGVGRDTEFETVSTVSCRRGKPLKRLTIAPRRSTRLKPGANESGHGLKGKANLPTYKTTH